MKDDITHITVAYTKMINTRPTAYLTGLIGQVLPNYSDINSLNVGSLNSFQGLTTSYGRSILGGVMGTNNYDAILGGSFGNFAEGSQIKGVADGKMYTVTNGKPVLNK